MTRTLLQEIDLDTGVVVTEIHQLNGQRHRDPAFGPAYIFRDSESGAVATERYYWQGRLHRIGGPAVLDHNLEGVVICEKYYRHGALHRNPKQGPAWIDRNRAGTVLTAERYYVSGQPYRDPADGPCQIGRYATGETEYETYFDRQGVEGPTRVTRRYPPSGTETKPSP
jgi:hypothetical protein